MAYRQEHGEAPPTLSVNAGISKSDCPVDFPRFDAVVRRILELGRGTWMAARDFADAYEAEFGFSVAGYQTLLATPAGEPQRLGTCSTGLGSFQCQTIGGPVDHGEILPGQLLLRSIRVIASVLVSTI